MNRTELVEIPGRPNRALLKLRRTDTGQVTLGLIKCALRGHLGALLRYDVALPEAAFGTTEAAFGTTDAAPLVFDEVRDLAWILIDGTPVGRLSRALHERALIVPRGGVLTVLVEDQWRVNYDARLGEQKGLIGAVHLGGAPLTGWTATPVDLTAVHDAIAAASAGPAGGRTGLRGELSLTEPVDLFLDTATLGKGYAFVNGFLLGRHWVNGPQRTLFVPAPVTRAGANELGIAELEQVTAAHARFIQAPDLGHLEEYPPAPTMRKRSAPP